MQIRRVDRVVEDHARIVQVLKEARIVRLAYVDGAGLTIVPVTFCVQEAEGKTVFYLHGAKAGRKFAAFAPGCDVAFEAEGERRAVIKAHPCNNSWEYVSVVGNGRVTLVTDPQEAAQALTQLVLEHAGSQARPVDEELAQSVAVFRLEVTQMSCKARG